jgi:Flagellar motor component
MDIFSIIGFLAFGTLLLGAFLDGAHLAILIQPPAFLNSNTIYPFGSAWFRASWQDRLYNKSPKNGL